jgi:hypothetical protein
MFKESRVLRELTSESIEQRAKVSLCLRETVELVPGPFDGAADFLNHLINSKYVRLATRNIDHQFDDQLETHNFQRLGETLFLWRSFMILSVALRLVGQTVVGVGASDSAIRLIEDLLSLFQERANL